MTSARLRTAAHELREILADIAEHDAALVTLNDRRKAMERDILPELFTESGVTSIQLEDGSRITLSTMSEGSLPKDPAARAAALEWLSANGFENLIECRLAASWTRGDRAKAQVEYERLAALGTAKVALDETIHPMTLGARIRDRIVAGQPTPLDLIGVSVFQRARFTKKAGTSNDQ